MPLIAECRLTTWTSIQWITRCEKHCTAQYVKDGNLHCKSFQSRDPGISLIAVFETDGNLLHLYVEISTSWMMTMMMTTIWLFVPPWTTDTRTDRQIDRQLIITYIVRFGDCKGQNAPNRLRLSSPQTTLGEFTMGDRLSAVFQQQFSAFFTCVQVLILRLASLYFFGLTLTSSHLVTPIRALPLYLICIYKLFSLCNINNDKTSSCNSGLKKFCKSCETF